MKEYSVNCDIARDLMPLVIDDAASEAAREAVNGHLKDCEACRGVMEAMRREQKLPEDGDDTRFIQFCKRMEKRFTRQHLVAWVCGVLAVLLIAVGGWRFVRYQCYEHMVPMKITEEGAGDIRLVQDQFGNVEIRFTVEDETRPCIGWSARFDPVRDAAGVHVWFQPEQPAWPQWFGSDGQTGEIVIDTDLKIIDGQLMSVEYDSWEEPDEYGNYVEKYRLYSSAPVAELWLGEIESEDALLLWKKDDPADFPVVVEPHI